MDKTLTLLWDTFEASYATYESLQVKKCKDTFRPLSRYTSHIPKQIKQYINKTYKTCKEITFTYRKLQCMIRIHNKEIYKYDDSFIKLIIIIYKLSKHKPRELNISIYGTEFKKQLPKYDYVIKPIHVSSGYSTIYIDKKRSDMVLFRTEELLKNFIYELCNVFEIDRNISLDTRCGRAYTEFWSIFIHCAFYAYINSSTCSEYKTMCSNNIAQEVEFSIIQSNKIIRHMYAHYNVLIEEYKHNKDISILYELYYNEDTYIFMHYVLKTVLLYNYDAFLIYCYENNDKLLTITSSDSFIQKLITYYKTCDFIDSLYDYIDIKNGTHLRVTSLYIE